MLGPNETLSANNELLAQMLEVMERLAAYAYFWDSSEIEFDFSSLVRILDPRTDNYPNSKLYCCKNSELEPLGTLYNVYI